MSKGARNRTIQLRVVACLQAGLAVGSLLLYLFLRPAAAAAARPVAPSGTYAAANPAFAESSGKTGGLLPPNVQPLPPNGQLPALCSRHAAHQRLPLSPPFTRFMTMVGAGVKGHPHLSCRQGALCEIRPGGNWHPQLSLPQEPQCLQRCRPGRRAGKCQLSQVRSTASQHTDWQRRLPRTATIQQRVSSNVLTT